MISTLSATNISCTGTKPLEYQADMVEQFASNGGVRYVICFTEKSIVGGLAQPLTVTVVGPNNEKGKAMIKNPPIFPKVA